MNFKKIEEIIYTILLIPLGLVFSLVILYLAVLGYWYIKYPDPDCKNTNKIFNEYSPNTLEYNTELIRLLKKTESLETSYWLGGYLDPEHISIFIQNDSICTIALITINAHKLKNDGGFLTHLMQVNGVSYNGPLTGVKFEFSNNKNNPEIFLIAVEDIID
ncbi:MAG: hypothetical protein H6589_07690 [Flavobacteriales bacterium]|nr:hypothetical protein [Flavobacteriales bacterium]